MAWPLSEADKAFLRQLAEKSPPFTPEQRRRLRPLLKGTLTPVFAARETQAA